jgi:hypothetical protein
MECFMERDFCVVSLQLDEVIPETDWPRIVPAEHSSDWIELDPLDKLLGITREPIPNAHPCGLRGSSSCIALARLPPHVRPDSKPVLVVDVDHARGLILRRYAGDALATYLTDHIKAPGVFAAAVQSLSSSN